MKEKEILNSKLTKMKLIKTYSSSSINDRIGEIASTIYFGTNKKIIKEWSNIQDEYWNKYNLNALHPNEQAWCKISLSDQIIVLRKGRQLLKKYKIKIPAIYKCYESI